MNSSASTSGCTRCPLTRPHRRLRNTLAILLGTSLAATYPAQDDEPSGIDDLFEAGQALWDAYAPPEVKAEYEFPTREAAETFLGDVQRALSEGSFEDIAAYEPDARQALRVLRSFEGGDEMAAWLEPRLDFLVASGVAGGQEPLPAPQSPAPAPSRPALARPYWDRVVVAREAPGQAAALVPRLKQIFAAEGVPPQWIWIAEVESSMNPKARSPAGARGLFQFMPATAERFGLSVAWPDDRTNPEKSARAAARYLRVLHGTFADWPLALAAYNAGEGRVGRALKAAGASDFPGVAARLPAETRMYVPKVLATVARRESIKDPAGLPAPAAGAAGRSASQEKRYASSSGTEPSAQGVSSTDES